jgi:hypothetical protein
MQVNADLAIARARAHFDVEVMALLLVGGPVRSMQQRRFLEALEADPLFNNRLDIMEDRVTRYW